jgi:hypothetical protein
LATFVRESISDIASFLNYLCQLGRRDKNRNDPIFVVSPEARKEGAVISLAFYALNFANETRLYD